MESKLLQAFEQDLILLDGALGTELQKRGLGLGDQPELLNLKAPDRVASIHQDYVAAGAQMISTNTFGASAYKLEASGYQVGQVIQAGIDLARQANPKWVALSLGPIGKMMAPIGDMTFDMAYQAYRDQVIHSQGADCVLLETLSDLNEARAAILAVKEHTDLPVIVSMTFQEDQRTLTGVTPEAYVEAVTALGVDALGVNCSLGPDQLLRVVDRLLKISDCPVIVQANAGLPLVVDKALTYSVSKTAYADFAKTLSEKGVALIGGCCGTDPSYIEEISKANLVRHERVIHKTALLSTPTSVRPFGAFTVIGERINPTGNASLKAALLQGKIEACSQEALKQVKAGCHVLDVNLGLPGIDEYETMMAVVDLLALAVDCPLQIDSSKVEVLEGALRRYPGRCIINSVSGKEEDMAAIFPLAKKYGAFVVCLTLDEEGVPKNSADRIRIGKKIINRGKAYGLEEGRLILDSLVMTISSQSQGGLDTLEAIRYFSSHYGVHTTLGISNISFGMPNRNLITRTYLTMALEAGLTSAIMDPCKLDLMESLWTCRMLLNQDPACGHYLASQRPLSKEVSTSGASLYDLVLEGNRSGLIDRIKVLLADQSPLEIIDHHLIPTLNQIGQAFEHKDLFLPQLIRSAETVGGGFDYLKSLNQGQDQVLDKGGIILATVKGDVHDIGKNLVKMLLENYGYGVLDLGKDVAGEDVIEAIKSSGIKLVGLSALMTTTVESMKDIISQVKAHDEGVTIFVGGAVLTESYARTIGADYYCQDGQASVNLAQGYYK